MFSLWLDYPSFTEEVEIVKRTTVDAETGINPVINREEIIDFQKLVRRVPVADNVIDYAVRVVNATRRGSEHADEKINEWIRWGAGPRASQYLILGAKTRAILDGRYAPSIEDVRAVALPVLRHRIVTNFNAEADGIGTPEIVQRLLSEKE